jgi:hypothetical protein
VPFADPPIWIDGLSLSGAVMRRAQAMNHASNGVAAGSVGGVRPGDPGLKVSLSGMTISVAGGVAAVPWAGQGVYRAYSSSTWTGTVTTAHASLQRLDLVYLRVWDNAVDASGLYQADIVYLAGTAGSGVPPTLTGTQINLPLAQITVPAGSTTPSVTDLRAWAVAPGGITQGSGGSGVYDGQFRDNPSAGTLERWSGTSSSWVQYARALPTSAAWTPTWTNLTLGNGSVVARYHRSGQRCHAELVLNWGSTTSNPSGIIQFSPPIQPASVGGMRWSGGVVINKGGGASFNSGSTWMYDATAGTAVVSIGVLTSAGVQSGLSGAGVTMLSGGWIIADIEYEVPAP